MTLSDAVKNNMFHTDNSCKRSDCDMGMNFTFLTGARLNNLRPTM